MSARMALLAAGLLASGPAAAYDFIKFIEPALPLPEAASAVAVAASRDRFYVVDEKKGALLVRGADGAALKSVSGELLSGPSSVALGPDGEVFVADRRNSRIQVFDPDGNFLRTIGAGGSDPGRLSKPSSVAVGADGRVYVADTGNDRVQVFTREGVFLFGFGGKGKEPGKLNSPTRIQVSVSDHVFVLDEGNERVQKFNPDTSFAREYALHGEDFAVDAFGFLYMLDAKHARVNELGPDGFVLGRFGSPGSGRGQFKKPRGIAVAPDGSFLVVDTGNKRVQRAVIENKLKLKPLPHNLATKLLVTGPSRSLELAASALASDGENLYAFSTRDRGFVVIGPDGKEKLRFSGGGEAATKSSLGLAVSREHGVFASDEKEDRLQHFGLDGVHRSAFGETKGIFASKKKEGRMKAPQGVAINEKGAVFVADTGNRRVDAFGFDGAFLFSFGPPVGAYELEEPVGVAWDEAGFVYVLDRKLKKILKCEPSGGFLKAWGAEGSEVDRFDDPVALAYDGKSYLYVLDQGHKRVAVFDRDGKWVTNFFAGGSDARSLDRPAAIAVLGDQLVVSDPGQNRVAAFGLHPLLAPPLEISTKAVEGEVVLQWEPLSDPWVRQYRVSRSTNPYGPFAELASVQKPEAKDAGVEAYKKYWYRVAVEAATGDLGPASAPVEVAVAGAFNQAPVEISTVTLGNVFSANYKWYLKNPLGKAVIVNNVNLPFKNVKVSFRLKDFMDFATEKVLPQIEAKQSVEVPLAATLNNKILDVSEDTPIQAEVTLTYHEKGKKQELSQALPLKVYSRHAITWEDPRRIANYATPKDPPVLDLRSEIERLELKEPAGAEHLNANLRIALRIWSALGALGVKFLPSPNSPFEQLSEDPAFPVDYTQFPRDTLRRKSGECDDLVTALASLLEAATVRAAMIDYPGHLALMFDTGSNDAFEIGLPEERLVEYEGTFWIPLEATMVGESFADAARKALSAYREMNAKGQAKIIDPRAAWEVYEPATLPPPEQEALKPEPAAVEKRLEPDAARLLKDRYEFLSRGLEEKLAAAAENAELLNQLGILEFEHGDRDRARKRFEAALAAEPGDASARNNLGNLSFLEEKLEDARKLYEEASARDSEDAQVWMNLLRVELKLGRREKAQEYARRALELDGTLKDQADSLLK